MPNSKSKRRSAVVTACLAALVFTAGAIQAGDKALARTMADADLQWGPCPAFFPDGCKIAVLQGDPSKPNADIFFKVPGNYDLPHHWHNSAERMVLVNGEMEVIYDGQESVLLTEGSYAYGPAKAPHRGRCVSSEPCILFIAFEQPVDALEVVSGAR